MSHLNSLSLRELRQLAYAKMRLPIVEEQERQACRGGLIHFVRYFWHILEPKTKLVEGWPLEAICEHLEAVTFGEITRLLMNVPPGFMKLCADSTPILTPDGYRTHGDLRPGDCVFGPDGKPTKVLKVSEKAQADYEVRFSTHETIKCNGDHLWTVYDRWAKKWKTVNTRELAEAGVEPDRRRFFIPDTHCLEFPERELPLHPYFFGCWLGDGTSTKPYISHSVNDTQHIQKMDWLGYQVKKQYQQDKTLHSVFTHQGVIQKIRALGVFGKKRIPEQYMLASAEQRRELLAGIIDTDGTVDQVRQRCVIYTCDPDLAEDIQLLILSLGMRPYITLMDAPGYGEYRSDKIYHMIGFQPDAPIPTAIPRKQFSRFDFARRKRAIVKVIKSEAPEMGHCITIDREDGLYVVGRTNVVTHNSLLTDVLWPAWEWGPMNMPHLRYVTFSYSVGLTMRDNGRFKELIISPEYQKLWGKRFGLRKVGEERVTNDKTGWKFASSVGGVGTGERGDRVLCDDPHNVKDSESDVVRSETIRWFQESMSNRLNDIEKSAVVVIMQRVHEEDVSGVILAEKLGYCHLMIPMRFDSTRYPFGYNGNDIGWLDPREEDGKYAWPERFPPDALAAFERRPYMWSGQYMQSPTPRGGGIIKEDAWQLWPSATYPQCELVLGSLDTASTEKEQNDASALTIWGVFRDGQGSPKAILLYAWEGRLEINDLVILVGLLCSVEKRPDKEYQKALALFNRGDEQTDTLYRVPVDRLLVENKNNGISVAHELYRLFGHSGNFAIELIDPKKFGDKVARIIACEPMFADEMVYAPDRAFAERVINNVAAVPKTSKWDTPDSVSQALLYMRKTGLLLRKDEQARVTHDELLFKPQLPALY